MSICTCPSKEVAALAKALNLPQHCTEFSLHFKVNEIALVKVTCYSTKSQLETLTEFAESYELTPVTEEFHLRKKNDH